MKHRKLLLASTSTVHGSGYLDYCEEEVKEFFSGCKDIRFVPYARPSGISHEGYTEKASDRFRAMGLPLNSLYDQQDPSATIEKADGIFIGGGNTFLLLHELYRLRLAEVIRLKVMDGIPYMGTSAGSNVAGLTINTTNDMPIIYPPTFKALALVMFNLNPHYLDPDPGSTHKGETRETRINEFHALEQNCQNVLGLREGSILKIRDGKMKLWGKPKMRLFRKGNPAEEFESGADLSFLL